MFTLNFIIILLVVFVDYLGLAIIYPVFAALIFDPSYALLPEGSSAIFSGAILGILIGLTPLTQFFSAPILGLLSDYYGRRRLILYGMIVGCVGYALAIVGVWCHSLYLLLIYRVCVGISEGTIGVAQAMIGDISTEEIKARRFALSSAAAGIGFMIGPFLGGILADPSIASWTGYEAPFAAALMMCFVNVILAAFGFSETFQPSQKKEFKLFEGIDNLCKVFFWPKLYWLFLATFAFSFGWSFFNEFIPILLRSNFSFSTSEVGNYYAYGGVWYALSAGLAISALMNYFSPEKMIVKASIGCGLCMLIFIFIPESYYIWWILPPFMLMLALTFPTTAALVSNYASKSNQGEVFGVYQSVMAAAMSLSPLLLGGVVGAYPAWISWGGALAMMVAAFSFWKICHQAAYPQLIED